jgi:predicted nucleic acid-binding protein
MKIILDSDSLIKLAKSGTKEVVMKNNEICIPPEVKEETVTVPKKEGFADAIIIEQNLKKHVNLLNPKKREDVEEMIESLNLDAGEADVFRLYYSGEFDGISSDDSKFIRMLDELGIPFLTPSALVVNLFHRKIISKKQARDYLKNLYGMISEEEYHFSLDILGGE